LPVIEFVVDGRRERDAVSRSFKGDVETGEKSESPRQDGRDTAQISTEYLPGQQRAAFGGSRELGEETEDFVVSLGGQGDQTVDRVDDPSEEFLRRGPIGITEFELFDGVRSFAVPVLLVVCAEEQVKAMEDVAPCLSQLVGGALPQCQEIIDEDVDVGEGVSGWYVGQGLGRRFRCAGCWWPCELLERMLRSKVGHPP
jgi:hypothetical protein